MPRCMFHDITGFRCPGCGMQRAIYQALHGNFLEAWRLNYALPVIMIIVCLYSVAEICRKRNQKLYLVLHHPVALAILCVIVLVWWIGRNIVEV
ncbi:MAG: DUF2752 domain-containing protein [Muribaculaceae bacterium]|nr:DUF2752 domain-containing protein [Muribaculaceae bacterium]